MSAPEFIDPQGDLMVPLRCELCGEQIGVKSPGMDMSLVVARCYSCAATDEAEAILSENTRDPAGTVCVMCHDDGAPCSWCDSGAGNGQAISTNE